MDKGLPASSGVHGLRVGFSEVGPEVVIILTLGLDDLLLFLLSWNDKIKWNDKLTEDFLRSSLQRKKKTEEIWTYNPPKCSPSPSFYRECSSNGLVNFTCIAGIISSPFLLLYCVKEIDTILLFSIIKSNAEQRVQDLHRKSRHYA